MSHNQTRCAALDREIQQHTADTPQVNLAGLETLMRAKLTIWRGLIQRSVQDARDVLRELLIGPVRFTPIDEERRRGYAFTFTIALDEVLSGVVELPTKMASPRGTAQGWSPRLSGVAA